MLCSHCGAAVQLHVGQFGGFPRRLVFSAGLVLWCLVAAALLLLVVAAPVRTKQRGWVLSRSGDFKDRSSDLKPTEPEGSEGLAFGRLSLLPEELLEGAPEASFLLLPTPLTEGGVVTLLCPAPPLCLLPPRLEPRVLETSNVNYSLQRHFCYFLLSLLALLTSEKYRF